MDHSKHEAGTVKECKKCQEAAYEPGWYAVLLRIRERPQTLVLEMAEPLSA
jgi:hypothetical protein